MGPVPKRPLGERIRVFKLASGERDKGRAILGIATEDLVPGNRLEAKEGRSIVEGNQVDVVDSEGFLEVSAKTGAFFTCWRRAEQDGDVYISARA